MKSNLSDIVIIVIILLLLNGGGSGGKPDAVTYVYEKDNGPVPAFVASALDELNTRGYLATPVDDDAIDGDGQVPDGEKVAIEASKAIGVPCLITSKGSKVIKTIKNPLTKEEILKAAP